ncbi:unnamed protein product [Vitrella brassicaformis CCMP3155]|uniref:Apple domain-containing protein n=3 Tax=Vitrella brassicaformis TaxID=1169539 RepID=A0A0G4GC21_VITBC|nr:unnamed protein product [Vitrella brassicaformis CCMP3155]|eukprot:CEM26513.1 unnamed protein product [Vitrella brassicaformis CCMP3155]
MRALLLVCLISGCPPFMRRGGAFRMVQEPDGGCVEDSRRSSDCSDEDHVTVAPPANATCYEWDYTYEGFDLPDELGLGHTVARPYDCQRGCASNERCVGWTHSKIEGCYLKSSNAGRKPMPPNKTETQENWFVSGDKFSTDCDRGSLVSPCYEYNVACITGWARSHYREGMANVTLEECHDLCRGVPMCTVFAWHHRYPRDMKVYENMCILCNNKDRKICTPGAIMGQVEGRDCGPPASITFPPQPLPPLTEDGMHGKLADPAKYWGLPTDSNARALGKEGTAEELAYQRGDLGVPSFLSKPLRYGVTVNDTDNNVYYHLENCGCYHLGVQPDPKSSTLLASMKLQLYPAEQCQQLCQEDAQCEAFTSSFFVCLLWKDVSKWVLDQVEPIVVSGPKWCPAALIDAGYSCSIEHYRARFSSWALLFLYVPSDVTMPYGQSCPFHIDVGVIAFLMVACVLLLTAGGLAWHSRRRHGNTVVWRVMVATVAMLGTVFQLAFAAFLFVDSYKGWLVYVTMIHLICMVLFNEVVVILKNLNWVMSDPSYRQWFDSSSTSPDRRTFKLQGSDRGRGHGTLLKKAVTWCTVENRLSGSTSTPPDEDEDELDKDEDEDEPFTINFPIDLLSDATVFPPSLVLHHHQEQDEQQPARPEVEPHEHPHGDEAILSVQSVDDATPPGTHSLPTFSASLDDSFGVSTDMLVKEPHRGAEIRASDSLEWEEGRGLMFVLFASFFSISVLHVCWSNLWSRAFFAIPVASDAFVSLELLSLVGSLPMLAIQACAVFLSSSDGFLAAYVPPVTLTCLVLSAINVVGVLVRFVWWLVARRQPPKGK